MFADIRDTRIFFEVDGISVVPAVGRVIERPTAMLPHGGPRCGPYGDEIEFQGASIRGCNLSLSITAVTVARRAEIPISTRSTRMSRIWRPYGAHLGLGPIVSIGASYGGMVAMAHAARYPNAVSQLVLVATAPHKGLVDRAVEIVAERGTSEQAVMLDALFSGSLQGDDAMFEYFRTMGPLYGRTFDEAAFVKNPPRDDLQCRNRVSRRSAQAGTTRLSISETSSRTSQRRR